MYFFLDGMIDIELHVVFFLDFQKCFPPEWHGSNDHHLHTVNTISAVTDYVHKGPIPNGSGSKSERIKAYKTAV